ncbi:MAG: transposase [Acidobacteria bacterium]|nr:transposase [Acidobacteriota bacterium]
MNLAYTSQDCSQCGSRVRKSLAVREHRCINCGFVAHRDHNAAINIQCEPRRIPHYSRSSGLVGEVSICLLRLNYLH